ncbi:hypothetical protein V495_08425 [Pseudogymnoascus sp. VKM F-4514 (FW-929)]|nr:hypothetical protein V495_08425 [Pseudogymnoascus sp. VKM F-4514 (FW-929)]KFY56825.1 hypothetical protein V497_05951 [Pseudogymnoascus sp. VKM F-4516 (FW-969)]
MSFGIGIGDIVLLSDLAHRLGTTLTSGRKGATAEFQEVQNQLFAIGKALKSVSAIVELPKSLNGGQIVALEDEILGQMIKNCGATLKHLEGVLKKYPELRADAEQVEEKSRQKWIKEFKDNIKKIKFTTEGTGLDKLRSSLGIHVTALNCAVAACNYIQADKIKLQVEASHAKLEDMHDWFVTNIKFASDGPKQPKKTAGNIKIASMRPKGPMPAPGPVNAAGSYGFAMQQTNDSMSSLSISIVTPSEGSSLSEADFEGPERHVSFRKQSDEEELTFSISLKSSNIASAYLICPKASFNPEWMRSLDSKLFRCLCRNCVELDYTLVPPSIFVRITTDRPTWTIHAFSRASNSVVQLHISNVLSTRLADFEQHRLHLALVQGLRSASTGADPSMLIYTSVQNTQGSLSVLNAKSGTSSFPGDVRSVAINSNGLVYSLDIIESVQLLHYVSMLFQGPDGDATQDNLGLLPCRNAEIVIQTRNSSDDAEDGDVSQLVVQFGQFTAVYGDSSKPVIVLKSVNGKAFLRNNDRIDIQDAAITITFCSDQAAASFLSAIESLQRHLFISYNVSPRLEEVVKFRRNIGSVMIREMQLLDAVATMIEDPTTSEQRMVISSKCGSKFVTVIVPPTALGPSLSIDGPRIGPGVSAVFVNIDKGNTTIDKKSIGTISNLGGFLTEDMDTS